MAEITVHVLEVKGETDDPGEANLKLVVQKGDFTLDVQADATARAFPDYGFVVIAATGGDVPVDVQETTGESDDPDETEVELVVPKSLFNTPPEARTDLSAFTTSRALVIPLTDL